MMELVISFFYRHLTVYNILVQFVSYSRHHGINGSNYYRRYMANLAVPVIEMSFTDKLEVSPYNVKLLRKFAKFLTKTFNYSLSEVNYFVITY